MNITPEEKAFLVRVNSRSFAAAAECLAKAQAELQIANAMLEKLGGLEEFARGNGAGNLSSLRRSVYAKLQQEAKGEIQNAARRFLVYAGELRALGYNTDEDPFVKEANNILGINA